MKSKFKAKVTDPSTAPGSLSSAPVSGHSPKLSAKKNVSPFPSVDDASKIPTGLESSLLRQGAGVEEMSKRLNKFQGPWQSVPQAADDDNALS